MAELLQSFGALSGAAVIELRAVTDAAREGEEGGTDLTDADAQVEQGKLSVYMQVKFTLVSAYCF